jgi:hypothetical protein
MGAEMLVNKGSREGIICEEFEPEIAERILE